MTGILSKIRVVLIVGVSLLALASIAFLLAVNLSPLLISFPHQLGMRPHAILHAYGQLLLYLQLPGLKAPQLGKLALSTSAAHHFAMVKNYFMANEFLMVVTTVIAGWCLKRMKRRQQLWQLLAPLQYLFTLIIVVLALVMVNFADLFIKSHYLLFHDMDWVLSPANDPIILLMPVSFFSNVFVLWWGLLLFFLVVLWCSIWFRTRFLKF